MDCLPGSFSAFVDGTCADQGLSSSPCLVRAWTGVAGNRPRDGRVPSGAETGTGGTSVSGRPPIQGTGKVGGLAPSTVWDACIARTAPVIPVRADASPTGSRRVRCPFKTEHGRPIKCNGNGVVRMYPFGRTGAGRFSMSGRWECCGVPVRAFARSTALSPAAARAGCGRCRRPHAHPGSERDTMRLSDAPMIRQAAEGSTSRRR